MKHYLTSLCSTVIVAAGFVALISCIPATAMGSPGLFGPNAVLTGPATNPPVFRVGSPGVVPFGQRGGSLVVDVQLDASGQEVSTGFSLKFDPAVFILTNAVTGPDAFAKGFTLLTNQNRIAFGEIGIVLFNFASTTLNPSPPTNSVVRLTFNVKPTAPLGVTPIRFFGNGCGFNPTPATTPTDCSTAGLGPNSTAFAIFPTYTDGAANITSVPVGRLEGDINRASINIAGTGDNFVDGVDLAQYDDLLIRKSTLSPNEFQAMDDAPFAIGGDGCLKPDDKQQIRLYRLAPTSVVAAFGPTAEGTCLIGGGAGGATDNSGANADQVTLKPRQLRINAANAQTSGVAVIPVDLVALGGETAVQFSLVFDPATFSVSSATGIGASPNPDVVLGAGLPSGCSSYTVDGSQAAVGRIGINLDCAPLTFSAGTDQIFNLNLHVKPTAATGVTYPLVLSNSPFAAGMTDIQANDLSFSPVDGAVTVLAPPPTGFTVSGRIFKPDGITGIGSVRVTLTGDPNGPRSAITNSFGVYQFTLVPGGQTYTLDARKKTFRFQPQTIAVAGGNLANVNFIGIE